MSNKTIKKIMRTRGNTHGDFEHQARVSQRLKDVVRDEAHSGNQRANFVLAEALDNVLQKTSRISCGDPYFVDHWADIIGYSKLAIREIRRINEYRKKSMKNGRGTTKND